MNQYFWKGRKVMLTGHTGFKGTWMSLMLEYLGAGICGYSLPIVSDSFYKSVHPEVEMCIEADIADSKLVSDTVNAYQPEIMFHFAAHSSLQGSMEIPDYIFRTNLVGTLNILEAARYSGTVRAIVIVTSDKCYFNCNKNVAYKEDSVLWATDPYSSSKVGQELLTACYRDTFFQNRENAIGIASARASNVIGAGDYNYTRLFPYVFDCFVNGRVPKIRNPHAVRPWQYILDVLYGYLLLAEKLYLNADKTAAFNGAYNFGPKDGDYMDVEHVIQMVSKCFDSAPYEILPGKDHIPHETKVLMLDSSKAQAILNWNPQYSVERALKEVSEFAKAEKDGRSRADLSRNVVAEYFRKIMEQICIKN